MRFNTWIWRCDTSGIRSIGHFSDYIKIVPDKFCVYKHCINILFTKIHFFTNNVSHLETNLVFIGYKEIWYVLRCLHWWWHRVITSILIKKFLELAKCIKWSCYCCILGATCELALGECLADIKDCTAGEPRPDLPCDSGECCHANEPTKILWTTQIWTTGESYPCLFNLIITSFRFLWIICAVFVN